MAVLCEALSVIVRRDAIDARYPGGWDAFAAAAPNDTLCTDGALARVGFMAPPEVDRFLRRLVAAGLRFMADGRCVDLAVVDQLRGPTARVDWLEYGTLPLGVPGRHVAACWLHEGPRQAVGLHVPGDGLRLVVPAGWQYEGSISAAPGFVPTAEIGRRMRFLRREDGVDVYLDLASGEERFLARSVD